jgi:hypothetical protein
MYSQVIDLWFKKDQHLRGQKKNGIVIDLLMRIEPPGMGIVWQA